MLDPGIYIDLSPGAAIISTMNPDSVREDPIADRINGKRDGLIDESFSRALKEIRAEELFHSLELKRSVRPLNKIREFQELLEQFAFPGMVQSQLAYDHLVKSRGVADFRFDADLGVLKNGSDKVVAKAYPIGSEKPSAIGRGNGADAFQWAWSPNNSAAVDRSAQDVFEFLDETYNLCASSRCIELISDEIDQCVDDYQIGRMLSSAVVGSRSDMAAGWISIADETGKEQYVLLVDDGDYPTLGRMEQREAIRLMGRVFSSDIVQEFREFGADPINCFVSLAEALGLPVDCGGDYAWAMPQESLNGPAISIMAKDGRYNVLMQL